MLQKLIIENYAIIDRLELEFERGLNIFTGETGAGKSIIVGAINLLLGDRLPQGILRKEAKKGFVEGVFSIDSINAPDTHTKEELLKNSASGALILRREITKSGGKVFINGKPSTVQNLKKAVMGIIDLHGQHQHQSLLYNDNYYDIIDRFGKSKVLADKTADSHKMITLLQDKKNSLIRKETELREMRDFLEFQLKEIRTVAPQPGEESELDKEFKLLQNAEKIKMLTKDCYSLLYDDENSAAAQIRNAKRNVDELSLYSSDVASLNEDLNNALVNVEEAAVFLQRYNGKIEYNPERLEEINLRLSTLKNLQNKYKLDIEGILEKQSEIEHSLQSTETLADEIKAVSNEIEAELKKFTELCNSLSLKRRQTAEKLQKSIFARLKVLGMEKSLFVVDVKQRASNQNISGGLKIIIDGKTLYGDINGIDEIQLLIATGKSELLLPVSQIASGGELSRIMLAIKSVLMKADRIPVLVFDEVDTGISGRIAAAIGKELKTLAGFHQLLCITHLPQIACKADRHFSVEKVELNGRIVTRVESLDAKGRITELAKLFAGDKITETHLKNAEELLRSRN